MARVAALCTLVLAAPFACAAASDRITVSLSGRPAALTVGGAWNATLVVRSDGRPAPGAAPQLVARLGAATHTFRSSKTGRAGTYRARVILSVPGRWSLTARLRGRTYRLGSITVRTRSPVFRIVEPFALAATPDGSIAFVNGRDHRVLRIDPRTRRITVAAGTGRPGTSGDGAPATQANVEFPIAVASDRSGNLFVVSDGTRVRRVDSATGVITHVAGTGERGFSGDGGPATVAKIDGVTAIAADATGNVYLAEYGGRIRRIDGASGIITTIAGTGVERSAGDGGPALQAQIDRPHGVAVAPDGSLYVSDTYAGRIRRIDSDGTITTVAGTGTPGFSGDGGRATAAQLHSPIQLTAAPGGGILVAEHGNGRLRRIDPGGAISTLALLPQVAGVAVDATGAVYASALEPGRLVAVDPNTGALRELAG